mmetsp:Transcript_26127/g.60323  ORF Transcript_26127/g.60323 Transcript_26127/m.60323 type:complete len:444 (-) Transcript_26127:487-1818(-)
MIGYTQARDLESVVEVFLLKVAVHGRTLRHIDSLHSDKVKAEDLRAAHTNHEPLQLLSMNRERPRLDSQRVLARVAHSVLEKRVPGNAVRIRVLEDLFARVHVEHNHVGSIVHDSELSSTGTEIQAADGRGVLHKLHWERVVHEDLEHPAVLQTNEQALASRGASNDLDVANDGVEHPLSLLHTLKIEELQLLLQAENDVNVCHDQQVAVQGLVDLLLDLVVHVVFILAGEFVHQDSIRELHGEPVLVHSDLLHIVAALDSHLLFSDQMLDNDIGHEVSVGITVLVQPVHGAEHQLVHGKGAVIASHRNIVLLGAWPDTPHPVSALRDVSEAHAFLGPKRHLSVRATKAQILSVGKVAQGARVKIELPVLANLGATQLVERERLIPACNGNNIRRFVSGRVPRQRPHRGVALDLNLLNALLVANGNLAIEQTKRQMLSIICPA